jgi:hypothetical protein
MSSAEAATVLNYILLELGEQGLPAGFEPYTEAEVEAIRRRPLDDAVEARRQIRERLLAQGVSLPPYQWQE